MRKWILIAGMMLTGCSEKKGGDTRFLLPWPNSQGVYELQEITLSTLSSPFAVEGDAAQVYAEPTFSASGFQGQVAKPHLSKSGDVYIPQDAESSIALSVYAQFERLLQFEQQLGIQNQISWPRQVGIELHVQGADGEAHNNAFYFTDLDAMGIVPYSMGTVPLAINHGIVAHEHFHAHFQRLVSQRMSHATGSTVSLVDRLFYPLLHFTGDPVVPASAVAIGTKAIELNAVVLRAWNEGLADFYAGTYMERADFFSASLSGVASARALDLATGPMESAAGLKIEGASLGRDLMVSRAYQQGTLLARLMYQLSRSGVEAPRVFLKRILGRLSHIADTVDPGFALEVMDFEAVVPILLEGFPVNAVACAKLKAVLSKNLMLRFDQCPTP